MMDNKLDQLTRKLYDEGLSKGRAEAETLLAEAESQAKKIVSDARREAEQIIKEAERNAAELKKNSETEVTLAGRQSVSRLREMIREMIVAKSVNDSVAQTAIDPVFIREMLIAVAKNWQGSSSEGIELKALLPADRQKELDAAFGASAKAILAEGVELQYADGVKSGFRIGPKAGGYHISFTEADFNALIGEYLRPKVAEMLYRQE